MCSESGIRSSVISKLLDTWLQAVLKRNNYNVKFAKNSPRVKRGFDEKLF
jgi:hypothetical protein